MTTNPIREEAAIRIKAKYGFGDGKKHEDTPKMKTKHEPLSDTRPLHEITNERFDARGRAALLALLTQQDKERGNEKQQNN